MEKNISFYEINTTYKGNYVYFKNKKKIGEIPYFNGDYDDFLDIVSSSDLYDRMELDKKYYMVVEDPWEIYGVISLHKGWTFIDCAEHDERVRISTAFPDKDCHI